jgi:hypothetical protein
VCLEREFSMAQIARHHFLLIGCYETPRADCCHSLRSHDLSLPESKADLLQIFICD